MPSIVVVVGNFEGNQSELGGAIAARHPGGMGAFSQFNRNEADLGGAYYGQLGPILGDLICPAAPSVFDDNHAVLGGAMYVLADSSVHCQGYFTNNTATSAAAVFLESGSLEDVSYAAGNVADDGSEVGLGAAGSIQRTLGSGQSLVVGIDGLGLSCAFVGPTNIDCHGTTGCVVCP